MAALAFGLVRPKFRTFNWKHRRQHWRHHRQWRSGSAGRRAILLWTHRRQPHGRLDACRSGKTLDLFACACRRGPDRAMHVQRGQTRRVRL